jgi:A/G-specific adenine glycosylase
LLGGMLEVPSTEWGPEQPDRAAALASAPLTARWRLLPGIVRHSFTHFDLELRVFRADGIDPARGVADGIWYARASLADEAIPNVMRKVLSYGLEG